MQTFKIGFIGGGNMANALIGGLIANGCAAEQIWVAEPDDAKATALASEFGVNMVTDVVAAAQPADLVVLAVKPQVLSDVCQQLTAATLTGKAVLSIAAGIRLASIERWLAKEIAVIRAMPNTPSLVGTGAAGLFANQHCGQHHRHMAESVLRAVGLAQWVTEEHLLDVVTAVSGSGPAYYFMLMEQMIQTGVDLGLSPKQARLLTLQTALGAAKMAMESDVEPAELRRRVTSPGGTTEQALDTFAAGGQAQLTAQALTAARDRAVELAELLDS